VARRACEVVVVGEVAGALRWAGAAPWWTFGAALVCSAGARAVACELVAAGRGVGVEECTEVAGGVS
jgi:hypothetical protein